MSRTPIRDPSSKTTQPQAYTGGIAQKLNQIKHIDTMREFTATYSNGVFRPAVPLDIEDGSTVVLSLADAPTLDQNAELFEASAGSWADIVDAEKLIDEIREMRIANSRHHPFPEAS